MKKIYLDHAATTPVAEEVAGAMKPYFNSKFGNASSLHSIGQEAKKALGDSRETIAKKINSKSNEVIFTSGGTESNNLALKGVAFANRKKGRHIITSQAEHGCVLNSCKWLEKQGFVVDYLPTDKYGFINLDKLEKTIRRDTILISIIHGNNEIGTINPIEEIGKICRDKGVYFHTDACQSFTKVPIDVEKQNIDLLTINSHKIYGPKGVGALFTREGTRLEPMAHGGGHEHGYRAGTENVSGIVGFAKATEVTTPEDIERMEDLRDHLIKRIINEIPNSRLNGHQEKRLCNNANFTFKFIEGDSMVMLLDRAGIAASTGSACSSASLEPSHVLTATGLPPEEAHGSLRITLGKYNTYEEIDYAVMNLKKIVERLREDEINEKNPVK